jgi:hypothetical protein
MLLGPSVCQLVGSLPGADSLPSGISRYFIWLAKKDVKANTSTMDAMLLWTRTTPPVLQVPMISPSMSPPATTILPTGTTLPSSTVMTHAILTSYDIMEPSSEVERASRIPIPIPIPSDVPSLVPSTADSNTSIILPSSTSQIPSDQPSLLPSITPSNDRV